MKEVIKFIPQNYTMYKNNKELKVEVYADLTSLRAIAYVGRSIKPSFHYRYTSIEHLEEATDKWFQNVVRNLTSIKKDKEEKKELQKELNTEKETPVGTIVHSGWGYEQTQCEYYQVTETKGKRVFLRPINGSVVKGSEGHDCCDMMPVKDSFIEGKEGFWSTVKVNKYNDKKYYKFSGFASYESVSVWNGGSNYCSWYY